MKRIINLLLVLATALSLAGCGGSAAKEAAAPTVEPTAAVTEAPTVQPTAEPTAEPTEAPAEESTGLRPEFKEAMDSYEAFYTEYCELLKEYKKSPTDMSVLTKYMNLMSKLTEMDEAFEKWESEDLNSEELKYYLDVNNRVLKMLTDAAS